MLCKAAADGTWRITAAGAAVDANGDAAGHGRLVGAVLQGGEKDGDSIP